MNNTEEEWRFYRWGAICISVTIIAMFGFCSRCSVENTAAITKWERGEYQYIKSAGPGSYEIKDIREPSGQAK